MPVYFFTWRSGRAYPGDTLYFWSPTLDLEPNPANYHDVPPELTIVAVTRHSANPLWNFWVMGVKIADAADPDTYTVKWTSQHVAVGDLEFDITVIARPSPSQITIPTGSPQSAIQDAIDGGYTLIDLSQATTN